MKKKFGLVFINILVLIGIILSLFFRIIKNEMWGDLPMTVGYMMINKRPIFLLINVLLMFSLLICNYLCLLNNKHFVDENNELKRNTSITLYSLNIFNLLFVIYSICSFWLNWPGI